MGLPQPLGWSLCSAMPTCCSRRLPRSTRTLTASRHRTCRASEDAMFRALYTAATGMVAQQLNLDNVANNLSNSSVSGFRRRRLQFQDLIYQNLVMPGAAATQNTTVASGLQVGLGTRTEASGV